MMFLHGKPGRLPRTPWLGLLCVVLLLGVFAVVVAEQTRHCSSAFILLPPALDVVVGCLVLVVGVFAVVDFFFLLAPLWLTII